MIKERGFKKYVLAASTAIKESIDKNPLAVKTTNELAMEAMLSRKQLQAAFREVAGMGIQEYQLAQRLKHAALLLQAGNIPIKEIAATCRYKSQRAFTTAFKKAYGSTPLEYQNQST